MSEPIIVLENATYAYPGKPALRGLDLRVGRGEVLGLLGPNGSGKTTLMHLLNGLVPCAGGLARVLGLDPWNDRVALQRALASVPEHPEVYPWMKVRQYVSFYRRCYSGWDTAYVQSQLDRFGVPLDDRLGGLSRGQKGLVSLFAALGRRGRVLLLDDPTLGLDVLARRHLYRTIVEELCDREVTTVFATHLPAEVEGVLTHLAFLQAGRVVEAGPVQEVKARHAGTGTAPSVEDLYIALMGGDHVA